MNIRPYGIAMQKAMRQAATYYESKCPWTMEALEDDKARFRWKEHGKDFVLTVAQEKAGDGVEITVSDTGNRAFVSGIVVSDYAKFGPRTLEGGLVLAVRRMVCNANRAYGREVRL